MMSPSVSQTTGAELVSRKTRLGPAGTVARVGVGLLLLYLTFFWRDPQWHDVALGLVGMPALAVAVALLWRRRSPRPLRATGPLGHALNLAVIIPLFWFPATAGAAFIFYGASMLLAAARRSGGCEVTAISNALLDRDDQVGCAVFLPIDAAERSVRRSAGNKFGRAV